MHPHSAFNGIIFLDVDGVLNTIQWFRETAHLRNYTVSKDVFECAKQIDPNRVAILNRVVQECNLGIVVSSTWGKFVWTYKAMRIGMKKGGMEDFDERCLGRTPRHSYVADCTRGLEIGQWMKENAFTGKFVILDDEGDMGEYLPHLILTKNFGEGLNEEVAEQIKSRFKD